MGEDGTEIRVKTAFNGDIMVTYIVPSIDLDGLRSGWLIALNCLANFDDV